MRTLILTFLILINFSDNSIGQEARINSIFSNISNEPELAGKAYKEGKVAYKKVFS